MDLYSLDKLIPEARKLAAEYRRATGQSLGISLEIARHDAAQCLNLELVPPGSQSYDAIGRGSREGRKYLVKGRAIFDEGKSGQRMGQLKQDQEWDAVLLVIMDEDYEPVEIYECTREELDEQLSGKKSAKGSMTVAKFKIISELVWDPEMGASDDEVWSNQ